MKKILISLLLLIAVPVSAMTLYEFYNGHLPSISDRGDIYKQEWSDTYVGTSGQNTKLLAYLQGNGNYNSDPVILGAVLPQGVAVFQTSLLSAITSSASSMTLTANSVRGGGTLSGYQCFTVDEGSTIAEYICGTVSGTAVSSLLRGVDTITGTTTNATLQFAHRRGAEVKITDFPVIQIMKHQLSGEDTFENLLQYLSGLTCSVTSSNYAICPKAYIDGVAVAGASNANTTTKGIVEIATAIEVASSSATGGTGAVTVIPSSSASSTPLRGCDGTATPGALCAVVAQNNGKLSANYISTSSPYRWGADDFYTGQNSFLATSTFATTTQNGAMFGTNTVTSVTCGETISGIVTPQPVMIATSSGRVSLVDGDVASTTNFIGFVINNCANGTTGYLQTEGVVKGFSGLTTGFEYYVSDTAGVLATTPGTAEQYVGRAISTSQIIVDNTRQNQYLGLQNLCTGGAGSVVIQVNQPWARYATVSGFGTNTDTDSAQYDLTISKVGHTSGSQGFHVTTHSVGVFLALSWSGNAITCTPTGNGANATAYYYR